MWTDRQLPEGKEIFLDHIGYFVEDIHAVSGGFERLGFNVSPVNVHYNFLEDGSYVKSGTANRLLTLKTGYIEVLGAVAETPLADELKKQLARHTGLHLFAFTHQDAESEHKRLVAAGFEPQPAVRLRRFVETAEGKKTLRATVVRAQPGSMPEGRVQILSHDTPELIWREGSASHPNRAVALTDVLTVTDDPDEAMDRYSRFTGCGSRVDGDLRVVELSRGRLTFASVESAGRILPGLEVPGLPFIAAMGLYSQEVDATLEILDQNNVNSRADYKSAVCVFPKDALGAYIVFHTAKSDCPWVYL